MLSRELYLHTTWQNTTKRDQKYLKGYVFVFNLLLFLNKMCPRSLFWGFDLNVGESLPTKPLSRTARFSWLHWPKFDSNETNYIEINISAKTDFEHMKTINENFLFQATPRCAFPTLSSTTHYMR